jgi:undecaprenyl phosphate N,N'-diacetylbacillosamine 1-phosphate transferase
MGFYQRYGKRILDWWFTLIVLTIFFWIPLAIFLLYLMLAEFPIFYLSRRSGKGCVEFTMYKFRTLKSEPDTPLKERRFWLGKMLRFLNLDELPQLINILRGEMSWVGPRPLPIEYMTRLSTDQKERYAVLPGITGLAQIHGKNNLSWDEKFSWDITYIRSISLGTDLLILAKTIVFMFSFHHDTSLDEKPLNQ